MRKAKGRDGRVDEGGGLEIPCGPRAHRGFESRSLRLKPPGTGSKSARPRREKESMSKAENAHGVRMQEFAHEKQEPIEIESNTLPRILPLEEAARELQMSVEHLTDLVQSGRVPAYLAPDGKSMMVPVPLPEPPKQPPSSPASRDANGNEPRRLTLEEINQRLIEVKREQFAHLEGKGITAREASQKYGVPKPTLHRWAKRGYVRLLHRGTDVSNPSLFDESDVAYCAAIHKIRREIGIPSGAPLLDHKGNPHLFRRPMSLLQK